MKYLLMSAVFILGTFGVSAVGHAEETKVVTQPQIIVKTKGPRENSPLRPLFVNPYTGERITSATPPKNRKETSVLTDANGAIYQVVRYTKYDSDGNPSVRTVVTGPDGREVELKTKVETD